MTENAVYSIGIDLGTTHCVLSYLDLSSELENRQPEVFDIPQLIEPGLIESRKQLPSFVYLPHTSELTEGQKRLPWVGDTEYVVGEIARYLGGKTPIRLAASAKSWLCQIGIDCKQPLLPIDVPEDVAKISPFNATKAYLLHLINAWNQQFPDHLLQQQVLTITVPASFDPAARELTVEAAKSVGLPHAVLLEEPQAALYSWIESTLGNWREQVAVGDVILVVDVGGGTSDFSLIVVTEESGLLQLKRVAVGDHILLGGDNMDLALAYTVKAKIESQTGRKLEPWQIQSLTHSCRDAKEKLFNQPDVMEIPLVVVGRGSSLIAGTLRSELTREELYRVLVEGFLPNCRIDEKPSMRARSGLRSVGLNYAQDAALTRHLAAFLSRQLSALNTHQSSTASQSEFLHPTHILFNGGVFKAECLADKLFSTVNEWLSNEQAPVAKRLTGTNLDLAVSRGAAYFGAVRQGKGVRITGGLPAAYYVGIESVMPAVPGLPPETEALCIAPLGMEEGSSLELPNEEFGLVIGEPVRFRFFGSKTRREDLPGMRLTDWLETELEELDEIEVTLPDMGFQSGDVIPVHLSVSVTEIGTLELHAISVRHQQQWKIEFDARLAECL